MKRLLLCALLLGLTLPSFAEVPKLISYSGKITDKNGKIVADADYVMTFSLYDSQTNGTVKWTETQTVNLAGGAYHVFLGSVNPNFPKFEQNYWLEVEFKGKKFGRQQIVTTPYSMRAQYANESQSLIESAVNAILPIGSIIPWHKNLPGVPALPSSFMECNGQLVTDTASPLRNSTLPNLNGEKRFLRGSNTSGTIQADELRSHKHNVTTSWPSANRTEWHVVSDWTDPNEGDMGSISYTGGSETRPINMSVVWIIKIK